MPTRRLKDYCSYRMLTILLLGFSSGLPLALVGSSLQAWFKSTGVDIVTIGFLALVGQPYAFKYLWAPFLDRFVPPFLGRRRGWLLITQLAMIITIIVMVSFEPNSSPWVLASLGLFLAFSSATQDIAIDAYRADMLDPDERGLGAALAVEGYRVAMLVSGGLALILADQVGWQITYLLMAGLMGLCVLVTLFAPEPEVQAPPPKHIVDAVVSSFKEFLTRPRAWVFIALILAYKLGDAFSHAFSTVFLLDMGFSQTAVGVIVKTGGLIASLLGVFIGGLLMTHIGLLRALLFFGVLQGVTNLCYMLLAMVGKNYWLASSGYFIESLCGGMGTAAFVALLMSLCNPRYTATQYALLSSLMAVGRVFVGPASGFMVKAMGWVAFYFATAWIAVPGILLVWWLRKEIIALDKRNQFGKQATEQLEADEGTPVRV